MRAAKRIVGLVAALCGVLGPPPNAATLGQPPPADVRAFDAGTSRELADGRGGYERADGTETTEFPAVPVSYRRSDGSRALDGDGYHSAGNPLRETIVAGAANSVTTAA
jgi:hypothetical protein